MIRLIRAEWTKLFTTKVWLGLLIGACVLAGGFAALLTAFAAGVELHELRSHTSGLEEIYFQLTSGSEQFAAPSPTAQEATR